MQPLTGKVAVVAGATRGAGRGIARMLGEAGATVYVTPGFLRSEAMLEHFGVSEANWRDGAAVDPNFIASETPCFVGRAVAALAADPAVHAKTGGIYTSWDLADEYGFADIDGGRPHWGRHYPQIQAEGER